MQSKLIEGYRERYIYNIARYLRYQKGIKIGDFIHRRNENMYEYKTLYDK
jgi:hypothetical protein